MSDGSEILIQRFDSVAMQRVVQEISITAVGAPGPAGGDGSQQATAGALISGDRALCWQNDGTLAHMSNNVPAKAYAYAGLSIAPAQPGTVVQFRKIGPITANFWTWSPGPVFVGLDGQLTQVAPATGFVLPVGWSTSPTAIDLKPGTPFLRS